MTSDNVAAPERPRRRRRLIVLVSVVLAALALAAAVGVLPGAGLRWGLVEALRRSGLAEVSLSKGNVSLFGGRVVVRRVVASGPDGSPVALGGLDLNFHWKPLLQRRVSLSTLALDGVHVEIERRGGQYRINGLPTDVLGGDGTSSGTPWSFDIQSLNLSDSRISLVDGKTRVVVDIDSLFLENLQSWNPDTPTILRLRGRVNGSPLTMEGAVTPFSDPPGGDLHLAVEDFQLAAVEPLAKALGLSALSGALTADLSLKGRLGARIEGQGKMSLRDFAVSAQGTAVQAAKVGVDLARILGNQDSQRLVVAGGLEASDVGVTADGGKAKAGSLRVGAEDLEIALESGRVTWKGSVVADRASGGRDGLAATSSQVAWNGVVSVTDPARFIGRMAGLLETKATEVRYGGYILASRQGAVDGSVDLVAADKESPGLPLVTSVKVRSEGLSVSEPATGQDWLAVSRLEAGSLRHSPRTGVSVEDLVVVGVTAMQGTSPPRKTPWRVELRDGRINHLSLDGAGAVSGGDLRLGGLLVRLERTKSGFVGFQGAGAGEEEQASPPMPRITLARLVVTDRSRLLFEDRTPSEPVRLRVEGLELDVANLDSLHPRRGSPFSLKGSIDQASIKGTGSLRPFAETPSGNMKVEVRGLELPPLSPYAADTLGLHLRTGHFEGDLSMALEERKLDGNLTLTLSSLEAAEPDPNAPISREAAMPIGTVLNLLRDDDNMIRLAIPVTGDIGDPDFDVSDAVNQVIGGALRSTATNTLQVIFPVAALVKLVIDADEKTRLSLEPLSFDPGEVTLTSAHQERLTAVAELMRKRPGISLRLCGVASSASDWPELADRQRKEQLGHIADLQDLLGMSPSAKELPPPDRAMLLDLAEHRSRQAKAYLTNDAGIKAQRLFECRGLVEDKAPAARVDLLL